MGKDAAKRVAAAGVQAIRQSLTCSSSWARCLLQNPLQEEIQAIVQIKGPLAVLVGRAGSTTCTVSAGAQAKVAEGRCMHSWMAIPSCSAEPAQLKLLQTQLTWPY